MNFGKMIIQNPDQIFDTDEAKFNFFLLSLFEGLNIEKICNIPVILHSSIESFNKIFHQNRTNTAPPS